MSSPREPNGQEVNQQDQTQVLEFSAYGKLVQGTLLQTKRIPKVLNCDTSLIYDSNFV